MATATKTRPATATRDADARANLTRNVAALAEAQAALQSAEDEHRDAQRAYWRGQNVVADIKQRIDELSQEYNRVHPMGREALRTKIDDCAEPLRQAKMPMMELGRAEEGAAAKLRSAEQDVSWRRSSLREAAKQVVKAEAQQSAAALTTHVRGAVETLLQYGPDLGYLIYDGVAGPDVPGLDSDTRRVLDLLQSWDTFARGFRSSPWANATSMVEQDADAVLPTVPVD